MSIGEAMPAETGAVTVHPAGAVDAETACYPLRGLPVTMFKHLTI